MISVTCPQCQAGFEVDFEPGTRFTCGACGGEVAVPGPSHRAASSRGGAARSAARGRRRPPSNRPHPALIIGGGVVLVGLVAALLLMIPSDEGGGPDSGGVPDTPAGPASAGSSAGGTTAENPEEPQDPYTRARMAAYKAAGTEELLEFAAMAASRAEEARRHGREEAAEDYSRDAENAYRRVLDRDRDNEAARTALGFVRFSMKEARQVLESGHLSSSLKDDLMFFIEDFKAADLSVDRPVWLRVAGRAVTLGKRWEALQARLEEQISLAEERKTDPFYTKAERYGARLNEELSTRKVHEGGAVVDLHQPGVEGPAFSVHTFKPYVYLVQREDSGGEKRIAESWNQILQALLDTFYGRFGEELGVPPVDEPVAVVIFRDNTGYIRYMRRESPLATVSSAGHYEPVNNRLVCYMSTEDRQKETLFHEGTHQLVRWAMHENLGKARALQAGMRQGFWFSEGIADYFGGHSREFDPERRVNRYVPGRINGERVKTLAEARERGALFPLEKLLSYTRRDYVADKKSTDNQYKILVAYAQGWAMIYYMANWKDGRYLDRFKDYLRLEFKGRSGPDAFRQVFGDVGLDSFEAGFREMLDFLIEADKKGWIVNGRVVRFGEEEKPEGGEKGSGGGGDGGG